MNIKPSLRRNLKNPGSLRCTCVLALSCCMKISLPSSSSFGHFSLIAGTTLLVKKNLITSFPMEVIALVSSVPAGRFTLLHFAGSLVVNGKMPSFPSNFTLPWASNRGRATAAKNMTLSIKFLLLQVRYGSCETAFSL